MNDMIGNGARVLVVDDDKDVREVISDRLDHLGFVVVQASDGLDALAKMHQRRFDVVVTDCNTPRLDGLDFLRQCQLAWPGTPVILMSAVRDATEKLAEACGAFGGLRKPFDANRLITLVCQAAHRSIPLDPPSYGSKSNAGS
jgi:DNA-binding NtrC family response regulator